MATTPEKEHAVLTHTFEGLVHNSVADGLNITSQQGLVSIAQSLALLTVQKVEGYEWDELVNKVVDEEILTEFARSIGLGVLPSFMLYGRFIDNPLSLQDDKLRLAHNLREEIKPSRLKTLASSKEAALALEQAAQTAPQSEEELKELRLLQLVAFEGVTCPAANRGGEITQLAQFLLHLMPASI